MLALARGVGASERSAAPRVRWCLVIRRNYPFACPNKQVYTPTTVPRPRHAPSRPSRRRDDNGGGGVTDVTRRKCEPAQSTWSSRTRSGARRIATSLRSRGCRCAIKTGGFPSTLALSVCPTVRTSVANLLEPVSHADRTAQHVLLWSRRGQPRYSKLRETLWPQNFIPSV